MTASLSSRLRLSHVVHRGVLSAMMPRSCACDGPTGTSSRWQLTRKRVSQSQLRDVHAKEAAQTAVVRQRPLGEIGHGLPHAASVGNG